MFAPMYSSAFVTPALSGFFASTGHARSGVALDMLKGDADQPAQSFDEYMAEYMGGGALVAPAAAYVAPTYPAAPSYPRPARGVVPQHFVTRAEIKNPSEPFKKYMMNRDKSMRK